jgi:hypothetical protein
LACGDFLVSLPLRAGTAVTMILAIHGQIAFLEIPPCSVTDFIGIFHDDPTMDEICGEAYRQRDAERNP